MPTRASARWRVNSKPCATCASPPPTAPRPPRSRSPTRSTPLPTASKRPRKSSTAPSATASRSVEERALALADWVCNAYIGPCEAASCVRSHISPGPYRSFRELSLAGSVDPDIWCPPTFVGNSGIECCNGVRGFALLFVVCDFVLPAHVPSYSANAGYPVRRGVSVESLKSLEYWITRVRG